MEDPTQICIRLHVGVKDRLGVEGTNMLPYAATDGVIGKLVPRGGGGGRGLEYKKGRGARRLA